MSSYYWIDQIRDQPTFCLHYILRFLFALLSYENKDRVKGISGRGLAFRGSFWPRVALYFGEGELWMPAAAFAARPKCNVAWECCLCAGRVGVSGGVSRWDVVLWGRWWEKLRANFFIKDNFLTLGLLLRVSVVAEAAKCVKLVW